MQRASQISIILFGVASFAHILSILLSFEIGILITKPMLMLSLAAFLQVSTKYSEFKQWILLGLVFSWAGDVALLFHVETPILFMIGLGMFLLAHLYYIYGMFIYPNFRDGLLFKNPIWMFPFLFYCFGLMYLLWNNLSELRFPVLIYALVIMASGLSAINMQGRTENSSAGLLIVGILLFMASDSLIALDKFIGDQLSIPKPSLWIMLTYIAGQYLIVQGAVNANQQLAEMPINRA